MTLKEQIEQAMWDNDTDRLDELAPCICCCSDHTFSSCLARIRNGCRGSNSDRDIHESYAKWYFEIRGMENDEFFRY